MSEHEPPAGHPLSADPPIHPPDEVAAFRKRYYLDTCTIDCQEIVRIRSGDVVSLLDRIVDLKTEQID